MGNRIRPIGEDQKRIIDMSPVVSISDNELNFAKRLGFRRANSYLRHGGDTSRGKNIYDTQIEGTVSEVIVCKYTNSFPDLNIYNGGDNGYDIKIKGMEADIKSTYSTSPYLLDKSHKRIKDLYILVRFTKRDMSEGRILGYITGDEMEEAPVRRFPRDIKNRVVSWTKLNPIDELLW